MLAQRTSSMLLMTSLARSMVTAAEKNESARIGFATREMITNEFVINGKVHFAKVVQTGYPIKVMKNEFGIEKSVNFISVLISSLCNSFNVARNMTAEQILEYSYNLLKLISESFDPLDPAYRIEDIALFVEQAKTGRFGKVYNSLDVSVLEEWREIFDQERQIFYSEWVKAKESEVQNKDVEIKNPPTPETEAKFKAKMEQLMKSIRQESEDLTEEQMKRDEELRINRIEAKRKAFWKENYKPIERGADHEEK